jgi:hypothetical protein
VIIFILAIGPLSVDSCSLQEENQTKIDCHRPLTLNHGRQGAAAFASYSKAMLLSKAFVEFGRSHFIFCLNDVNMLKGMMGFDPHWKAGIIENEILLEAMKSIFHYSILDENAVN